MHPGLQRLVAEIPAACAVCRGHDQRMVRVVRRLCKITARFTPRLKRIAWAALLSDAMTRTLDGEGAGRSLEGGETRSLAQTQSKCAR